MAWAGTPPFGLRSSRPSPRRWSSTAATTFKETFVITLAAAGLALGLNQFWNRWLDASAPAARAPGLKLSHVAAAFAVWLGVALLLFSSFFTNAVGPLDSVRTYLPWLNRAGGDSPHIHPWGFYLHRLLCFHVAKGPVWSEAFILALAVVGARAAFVRQGLAGASARFVRFLALYTFALGWSAAPNDGSCGSC